MSDDKKILHVPGKTRNLRVEALTGHLSPVSSMAQTIAQRLYTARITAGMTQRELAGTEFSKSYISAIERGKMIPSLSALALLAERLGVPIAFLLGEDISQQTLSDHGPVIREEAVIGVLGRAEALIRQGPPDAAWEALGDEPTDDLSLRLRATWYRLAGWALRLMGRHDEAIHFLKRGLDLTEPLLQQGPHDQQDQLRQVVEWLHCFLGVSYCARNQMHLALEEYRRGLDAIGEQRITDPELKMLIYKGLGNVYLTLGRYREATTYYEQAIKQAVDLNDILQLVLCYWGLGVAFQESGNLEDAWATYQEALQIVGVQESWHLVAQMRALLGEVLVKLRYYGEAEEQLLKSLAGAQRLNDHHTAGNALLILAALHLARGKPEEAIKMIHEGLKQVSQRADPLTEGQLYLTLADAHTAQHEADATEQALKQAIKILEPTPVLGRACDQYARFLAEQGRFQEAYAQMELSRTLITR